MSNNSSKYKKIRNLLIDNEVFFKTLGTTLISIILIFIYYRQSQISDKQKEIMAKQTTLMDIQTKAAKKQLSLAEIQTEFIKKQFANNSAFETRQFSISQKQNALINKQTNIANRELLNTENQIESSKIPVLEIVGPQFNKIDILNLGGARLTDIEVIGFLTVYFNCSTEEITRQLISTANMGIIKDNLLPGEKFSLNSKLFLFFPSSSYSAKKSDEREAYAFILRYRRAADLKIFYKIISFEKTFDKQNILYEPLSLNSYSNTVSLNIGTQTFNKKLKKI